MNEIHHMHNDKTKIEKKIKQTNLLQTRFVPFIDGQSRVRNGFLLLQKKISTRFYNQSNCLKKNFLEFF